MTRYRTGRQDRHQSAVRIRGDRRSYEPAVLFADIFCVKMVRWCKVNIVGGASDSAGAVMNHV